MNWMSEWPTNWIDDRITNRVYCNDKTTSSVAAQLRYWFMIWNCSKNVWPWINYKLIYLEVESKYSWSKLGLKIFHRKSTEFRSWFRVEVDTAGHQSWCSIDTCRMEPELGTNKSKILWVFSSRRKIVYFESNILIISIEKLEFFPPKFPFHPSVDIHNCQFSTESRQIQIHPA